MTPATLPLLALALILLVLPLRHLLVLLLALSAIQDTPFLQAGSVPIGVGWFFAILATARAAVEIYPARRSEVVDSVLPVAPLWILLPYGPLALLLSLGLFYEQFPIMPGSAKFIMTNAQLFRPVPEQTRQIVYLVVTLISVVVLQVYIARMQQDAVSALSKAIYYSAAIFSSSVVAWHFLHLRFGLWFPIDFFHSNPFSAAWQQSLGGVVRVTGPFSEPSALAQFLAPVLFFCGTQFLLTMRFLPGVLAAGSALAIAASTSTTGYAVLAIFFLYLAGLSLFAGLFGRSGVRVRAAVALVIAAILVMAGIQYVLNNYDFYRELIQVTLQKQESSSYAERSASNVLAMNIFYSTFGIGVGLGTHRASGLFFNVAAAFGVVGILCFGAYILMHLRRTVLLCFKLPAEAPTIVSLAAAAMAGFAGAAISAGEVTGFNLYLPFALLSSMWISVLRRSESSPAEELTQESGPASSRFALRHGGWRAAGSVHGAWR
jgi:hypothetical protein